MPWQKRVSATVEQPRVSSLLLGHLALYGNTVEILSSVHRDAADAWPESRCTT